jgi:S-formylglutathione hydrolase FrmB
MHKLSLCTILFCFPFLTAGAFAQNRVDCNAMKSTILHETVRYCVMLPASYDAGIAAHPPRRYPVLYFLHGLGDNEQSLFKSGGWDLMQDLHDQGKMKDYLVVTPEGKASFYINSADGRVRYNDFFIREFIPNIETHYSIRRERSSRAISGISMGGYGALRFAFAYPELFSAVSAQSAALITEPPSKINSSAQTTGQLGKLLTSVSGNPINVQHWNRNSPFVLARQNRGSIMKLAIYFNCGTEDEFGFEKGAAALDKQLISEGIRHDFHLYPGNHSAAYFLNHLPEVLIFHSRLFSDDK